MIKTKEFVQFTPYLHWEGEVWIEQTYDKEIIDISPLENGVGLGLFCIDCMKKITNALEHWGKFHKS